MKYKPVPIKTALVPLRKAFSAGKKVELIFLSFPRFPTRKPSGGRLGGAAIGHQERQREHHQREQRQHREVGAERKASRGRPREEQRVQTGIPTAATTG